MSTKGRVHILPHRAIMLALAVAACVGAHGCAARPQDCAQPDVRCAGLVTDFGSVDEGMSQQAWLALQDARSAGLLDRVDFIETVDTRDREANISAFGEDGYDIIVTVGQGIANETIAAAQKYPDLYFIGIQQMPDAVSDLTNFVTLVFHEDRSGFLAGALADMLTRTRHVAAVCEVNFIDSIRRYCDGFRAGAVYADPAIDVDVIYRSGSQELLFRDVDWGRATALLALEQGADVLFAVGAETADAALTAAAARGALVIGAETDQYTRLPEIRPQLVSSAILDVRLGVLTLLQRALEGQFPGDEYVGSVGLAPFHEFEDRMAPEMVTKLETIAGDLESGAIKTDVPYEVQ